MATKGHKKSNTLKSKLEALQAELAAAEAAERKADQAELLRLIDKSDCLAAALAWARDRAAPAPRKTAARV